MKTKELKFECPICSSKIKCKSNGNVIRGICSLCSYEINYPDVVNIAIKNDKIKKEY